MRILIAADMEGVSGVVHWDHVDSKHSEYARFRKLMTGDVDAAVRGAFDGGAEEVVVSDGHGNGRNILVEELDPRVRLNSGSPSPLAMVQGADGGFDAVLFVGYHARVGAQNAILDHTWSGSSAGVWVNGRAMGEIGLNAMLCGHYGTPVLFVSGDQTACAEAVELLGPIETAAVKQATGRMAAECLSPELAQQRIYDGVVRAIQRYRDGQAPGALRLQTPITVTIELVTSETADRAAILPGARRLEGKRVEVTSDDALSAYRAFRAVMGLARD